MLRDAFKNVAKIALAILALGLFAYAAPAIFCLYCLGCGIYVVVKMIDEI